MNILLTKPSHPRLSEIIYRTRLFNALDTARLHQHATLVSGPPGSGKTTLISSYVESRSFPCLWYQMDQEDEDLFKFFDCFGRAGKSHLNETSWLPTPPASTAPPNWHHFCRLYFRQLYWALGSQFVIVLDNFQGFTKGSPLHDVVRIACEEMPVNGHMIIASRDGCQQAFARMRSHGTLKLIDAADLAFTFDEVAQLMHANSWPTPSASSLSDLHTHTLGWITGILALLHLRNHEHLQFSLDDGLCEELLAYFDSEVFMQLPSGWRTNLPRCALLPEMTMEQFAQITGMPDDVALLEELAGRGAFVTRSLQAGKKPIYRFHPMFRQFLAYQARNQYGGTLRHSLCVGSAELLISNNNLDDGMMLLEQVRDWDRMAKAIMDAAPELKSQGRQDSLSYWLGQLPEALILKNPWLLYWQGTAVALSSPLKSCKLLEAAYQGFREAGDLTGMATSWTGIVQANSCLHRNLPEIDYWIEEFDRKISGKLEELPANVRTGVTLRFFMILSIRHPLHQDIPFWLKQIHQLIASNACAGEQVLLLQNLAIHHILRGEHADAEIIMTMYRTLAPPVSQERALDTLIRHANDATIYMHMGMGTQCLQAVTFGLSVAKDLNYHLLDPVLLSHGALMSLNLGELARADGFLATFDTVSPPPSSVDLGTYYAAMAWRKFHAGELALALQLFRKSIAAAKDRGAVYFLAAKLLGFGLLLHLCGNSEDALRQLELGRNIGKGTGNATIEYAYQLFSAYVAAELRDARKADAHLAAGLAIGKEHGYMHFFFFPGKVISELCRMALESDIETAYVRALIERNRLTANPAWLLTESWPWPVRIYTLGRFAIVKRGETLKFSGKAQKKPLELLKAILGFGGRNVPEVKLADALWPEAEGDAATQALATTLFRLRKLIGEQVITRRDGRLTLNPSLCWVDCWAFERLVHADLDNSDTRIAKLKKLYQGPFLDSEEHAAWIAPMRERLGACMARLSGD